MINAVWLLSHCMAASTPQRHVPEVGRGIVLEALGEGRWCGWDRQGLEWHRGSVSDCSLHNIKLVFPTFYPGQLLPRFPLPVLSFAIYITNMATR